ncbi:MAG: hypothetical protein FE78DRAFT_135907 [Acidomyces sp. 'richmondensis']|nr:MAG: hypothetical protein FE78DRAFT_135907 [Acidomyces sp. 'richmondensis']
MGLSAPKRRGKLSQDPNNTAWSNSTTNYGRRILAAQGWQPGDYLGAQNASHSQHYTAANASHIRVLLREGNLGLGAKIGGKAHAESFGLSTLAGIFGRLNGKSDGDIQRQQDDLRDADLRTYQAQKYGFMNFVRGGLLIGDKIEEDKRADLTLPTVGREVSVGKKRKLGDDSEETGRHSKSKDSVKDDNPDTISEVSTHNTEGIADIEAKAAKRAARAARRADKEKRSQDHESRQTPDEKADSDRARLKQEKRARKEERRKRKEHKRLALAQKSLGSPTGASDSMVHQESTSATTSGTSTPSLVSDGNRGGRNLLRHRYIQQKRLASANAQALNEILMIKASVPA